MSRRCRCQGRRFHFGQQVKGTGRGTHGTGRHLQVARRSGQTAVPEEELNGANIGAGLKQVRGEGVTQRVSSNRLGDARCAVGFLAGQRDSTAGGLSP